MRRNLWIGALVAATGVLTSAVGGAAVEGALRSRLIETGTVHAPRGFSELCERRPEICPTRKTGSEVGPIATLMNRMYGGGALLVDTPELTPERMATLQRVNSAVNTSIRPVEDRGGDLWSLSPIAGDCEEYVLMKREMLARLGFPRSALRITVVRGADYQYHAVLVISTRGGEFILDNMVPEIVRVEDTPYEFVVSQSLALPGEWVRVERH